ncbi:MAG: YqgE/AlgH family protein [Bacteroidales bacterium]
MHSKERLKRGNILISQPFGGGDLFHRSVVLLISCSQEGSMGLVLNKPAEGELHSYLDLELTMLSFKVGKGGPMEEDRLFVLHSGVYDIMDSEHVKPDLYIGGDIDVIFNKMYKREIDSEHLRFFLGYAGWSRGQLEEEIEAGQWIVKDADTADIMNKYVGDATWSDLLQSIGGEYAQWAAYPDDPRFN